MQYDIGKFDKANKIIDIKHNTSRTDNIPDANKANNIKKEAKIYEFNLF